ncbi:hypothetical protein [Streptomyces sp. NPDC006368]|uniref:hypothetical protein n=1 Tax=Streptomyces sp. NPDC006368 TaxID=3156760 RepID=UPI0033AA2E16
MARPRLVRRQRIEPEIDFYGLCLQDADLSRVPEPYPGARVSEDFLHPHAGRVDIESAGHTHTAVMTAEVWDNEPPADTSQTWEAQDEAGIRCESGSLQIWGVSCGPIPDEIELGDPGRQWKVRVYCTGREEVVRVIDDKGTAAGVERYLVQFWPREP